MSGTLTQHNSSSSLNDFQISQADDKDVEVVEQVEGRGGAVRVTASPKLGRQAQEDRSPQHRKIEARSTGGAGNEGLGEDGVQPWGG